MTHLQLRRATMNLGWSYPELARRVGASPIMVWRWSKGQYPIPAEIADWITECVRIGSTMPPAPKDWRSK
jgi:transcriptional regulator with XRE-family HTH domain